MTDRSRPEDDERRGDAPATSDSFERSSDLGGRDDGSDDRSDRARDSAVDRRTADVDSRTADVGSPTVDGEDEAARDGEDEASHHEDDDPSLAGIFGARPEDAPPRPALEPESPSLENAAFVVLGVLFGLFVAYRAMAVLPT